LLLTVRLRKERLMDVLAFATLISAQFLAVIYTQHWHGPG
jgi:hypothetical protein